MKNKLVIILNNAELYRKANKKQKSQLLKELSLILHMNKQYISSLLRNSGKKLIRKSRTVVIADPTLSCVSKRGRKKVYDDSVEKALRKIWRLTGYASSKHLVGFIRLNHEILFNHPEVRKYVNERIKALLLKISHSTVDRLLKPYRDRIKLKQKYRSNPFSSNLKKSIMVESWFDKPKQPGYLEIDLVHHSGASGKGEFIYTLTATEVSTGWTELRPIKNKAMIWTVQALEEILKVMPVPVRAIHSDNGSEFINAHMERFCKERGIRFTRSRPYRKNDAPYVESKNWSMVRAYTG
ncbi:DDE-type integrase/transposase/recombinase [Thermodesulfovibrio sp. TK110]